MEDAYERKTFRYADLGAEAEQQAWKIRIRPVEVGCRGTHSKIGCLTHGDTSRECRDSLSKTVREMSDEVNGYG